MHTVPVLHTLLSQSVSSLHHSVRLKALMAAIGALMHGANASITSLGRGFTGRAYDKHKIKRVDRLLSCMMAAMVTWIYANRLSYKPKRCYAANNRKHFAFSDMRKFITQAALSNDFVLVWPKSDQTNTKFIYHRATTHGCIGKSLKL